MTGISGRNYGLASMVAALYAASVGAELQTSRKAARPSPPIVRREPEKWKPAARRVRDPEREAAAQAKRDRRNARRAARTADGVQP